MDSQTEYLLSLRAIRERAKIVADATHAGELSHFDFHEDLLGDVADFVTSVIKFPDMVSSFQRDYGPDKFDTIPPHGRWQHFDLGNVPRITALIRDWKVDAAKCDNYEVTRRLVDLFFVSVLLDAGAGDHWRYIEPSTEREYERSEGIAVASLYMFQSLAFAYTEHESDKVPLVNGKLLIERKGLEQLRTDVLEQGFQVSDSNSMLGIASRGDLLRSLGRSLLAHPDIFGNEGRPGNLVDYMIKTAGGSSELDIITLWDTLQTLLIPIWPKDRITIAGKAIGDAWPLQVLQRKACSSHNLTDSIQPFHKLTQWLTYSLMVPFQRILGLQWVNAESLTALAEYRNGGLFVDLGVLQLKKEALNRGLKESGGLLPMFEAGDDVIVEWRAVTLALIDELYKMVLSRMDGVHLTMAQLLEAGSWKSGREVAAKHRPETKSSPILIKSDGTVF
ncbi:hypothetical protein UA08_03141 [Talaromyces atroroseus]|uniref:Uracil catabolism protein 4 n=1 Tax=Talaromyces atroroseus TaxID=1441469 RepID=A0A225AKM5_TALAT|nr:hypothetical protein UA08_03141 [Talaromyces atroroseus]OKL61430.1 hypothetical protein UA08_03141 [Talaromyces atroroseus]